MRKTLKNDWYHGKWVLIWEYSARLFQWIPTWQGFNGFQKTSLHPFALDKSSLSIGRFSLLMLSLLSSKKHGREDFWKSSKPCQVGFHWIAPARYSQMSTHVPGFLSFFKGFFASFCIGQIRHQQHKGYKCARGSKSEATRPSRGPGIVLQWAQFPIDFSL